MQIIRAPLAGLTLILLFSVLALMSCDSLDADEDPGAVLTSDTMVDVGAATSVEVTVDVNTSADLKITDGPGPLLSAQFTYDERLEPDLSYAVDGKRGILEIDQPRLSNVTLGELENQWDLQFGSEAPVDLAIEMSSGDTELDVSTLALASFEVDTSSGNLNANIGGQQDNFESLRTSTLSGNIELTLDGVFKRLETIKLDESSGNITLNLNGEFIALDRVNVDSSSGNTLIDVTGSWARDLQASIDTSSGNVTLIIPADVGVGISANVTSGNINADGFRISGGNYVNDAYGTSDVTLEFNIDVTSGNITLELAE